MTMYTLITWLVHYARCIHIYLSHSLAACASIGRSGVGSRSPRIRCQPLCIDRYGKIIRGKTKVHFVHETIFFFLPLLSPSRFFLFILFSFFFSFFLLRGGNQLLGLYGLSRESFFRSMIYRDFAENITNLREAL